MKRELTYSLTFIAMLLSLLAGLSAGSDIFSPADVFLSITGAKTGLLADIIIKIRLPRVLCAAFVGAGLSVSGAAFQSIFRNPLADPFITGVSGGASLGVSVAIICSFGTLPLIFFSFAGSMFAVILLLVFTFGRGFGGGRFILAGVALSFIFSSSVMLLFSLASSQNVHKALIWMMGDLSSFAGSGQVWISLVMLVLILVVWMHFNHLNIISFGMHFSRGVGVSDVEVRILMVSVSVLTALSVVLGGIIPFVGLIVPHLARFIAGSDNRRIIPVSAALGASLLVLADAAGRSLIPPYEIPAGVITGFCGGVFFLVFVLTGRKGVTE